MCGVVGFWNREGEPASEVLLERMIEKIRYRGPDDKGTWTHGSIGFGHCRLSILDLSMKAHQPFLTSDGQGVLSYNGEVYNFKELRSDLEKEGIRFRSSSDTEVVLYALHQWGPEKAISKFNGMFAFSYYDLRNKTLWLGRDRAGIKPLYLAKVGKTLVFGSEIKSLFTHPAVPCKADMHALTTQLIYQRLDGSWTPFEKIESLLPGTILKVTSTSEEVITYFDLLRDVNVERIIKNKNVDFDLLLNEFNELLASSVKMHLISDAPLATLSSGGLDSSIMTAVAKEFKSDIIGYVADVKGVGIPEVPRAQKVCKHLRVELRQVKIDTEEYLRLWPTVVYQNDQPNYFAQNVAFTMLADAARRDGFKILLCGEGSDELFGGYTWHVDAYRMWRMRRLHSYLIPNIALFRKMGLIINKLAPLNLNELAKKPFEHLTKNSSPLVNDSLAYFALDGGQRAIREEALFQKLASIHPIEERAYLARAFEDFYSHLRTSLGCNDKMGMLQSIEVRVPYIENKLIDFGLHLPFKAKYDRGITKRIVKKAAETKIPHDIIRAKKVGFGISNHVWRNTKDFLKDGMLPELFKWGPSEMERVSNLVFGDHLMPYHFLSMDLWARIYLRNESPEKLGEQLLAVSQGNGRASQKANILSRPEVPVS